MQTTLEPAAVRSALPGSNALIQPQLPRAVSWARIHRKDLPNAISALLEPDAQLLLQDPRNAEKARTALKACQLALVAPQALHASIHPWLQLDAKQAHFPLGAQLNASHAPLDSMQTILVQYHAILAQKAMHAWVVMVMCLLSLALQIPRHFHAQRGPIRGAFLRRGANHAKKERTPIRQVHPAACRVLLGIHAMIHRRALRFAKLAHTAKAAKPIATFAPLERDLSSNG